MDTEDKGMLWCTTCEKESAEISCPDCGKPMLIIPSKETCVKMGTGIWKQLDQEYKKKEASEFSLDDFKETLKTFYSSGEFKDNRPLDEILKSEQEYWALISPHLGKTREQLEQDIPDGMYQIGAGPLVAWTGKGGLILAILAQQKEINKYKTDV